MSTHAPPSRTRLILFLIALTAALLLALEPPPLFAAPVSETLKFPDHGVLLDNISAAPGDTQRVVARWGAASDANGTADSYRVRWTSTKTSNGFPQTRTVTVLQDVALLPLPAFPDSSGVTVVVHAIRRGLISRDSVFGSRYFKRPDVPPPAPGPVIIDTGTVTVDSIAVLTHASSLMTVVPGGPQNADTTTACAFARWNGDWYEAEYSVVVRAVSETALSIASQTRFNTATCLGLASRRGFPHPITPNQFAPVAWSTGTDPGGSGLSRLGLQRAN